MSIPSFAWLLEDVILTGAAKSEINPAENIIRTINPKKIMSQGALKLLKKGNRANFL